MERKGNENIREAKFSFSLILRGSGQSPEKKRLALHILVNIVLIHTQLKIIFLSCDFCSSKI